MAAFTQRIIAELYVSEAYVVFALYDMRRTGMEDSDKGERK